MAAIAPSTTVDIQASNNITFNVPVNFASCTAGACGAISFRAGGAFNTNGNTITAGGRNLAIYGASIAVGDIDTSNSTANWNGGNITLQANSGTLSTGLIYSYDFSGTGNGGAINAISQGNLSTSILYSASNGISGGNVNLNSTNGGITTGDINSFGVSGNAGNVTLNSNSNISIGGLNSNSNAGNAGVINFTARDNINTASLNAFSFLGQAGNISLNAGNNINITNLSSNSFSGNGGNASLTAAGSITTGSMNTQSQDTISGQAGGNITINAGSTFLATGSFTARDGVTIASLSTQGTTGDGAININHGGSTTIPFVVGNATTNGTFRAITAGSGANTINNLTVPVPPAVNNYGTNISIRTTLPTANAIDPSILRLLTNPAPPLPPAPVVVGTPPVDVPSPVQVPDITPVVVPPPVVVQPINTPTPVPSPISTPISVALPPIAIATPTVQITRPSNLDATSPGVQPTIDQTQTCLFRSQEQNSFTWEIRRIPLTEICQWERRLRDYSNR